MKYILLLMLTVITAGVKAQTVNKTLDLKSFYGNNIIDYKKISDSTATWLIEYKHGSGYMIPLVGWVGPDSLNPNQPHYFSIIQVYKLVGQDTIKVGKEMQGRYVKRGCFEDVPAYWVRQACDTLKITKP